MNASDLTPPSGESLSGESDPERDVAAPSRLWRCTFCGTIRATDERPTRCFHCRRGESRHQLNEVRLFLKFELEELVGHE
jgi:hypothetical protein